MALIDVSQVNGLARKLATVSTHKQVLVAAAVKKGAQNIKESIQEDIKGSSNKGIRQVQIKYEMKVTDGTTIEADIGPVASGKQKKKGDSGPSVAAIAFFGTARGGGTHKFYEHGEDELPAVADYVHKAASGL
jgi:hypothetical protein